MPVRKLKEFLDQNGIKYVSIVHSPAYTAQEVAASAHITGRELAKVVIVELDKQMAMAVLPANRKIVLQELYVAEALTNNDEIAFNAGSHTEVIKMAFADFQRLVKPKIVSFTN